jgi:cellulose synthase/poly-beta-1,6-N-acetylglucosamine synthase-like glycosyltransferase
MAKIRKGKRIEAVFSVLRSFWLSLLWPLYCLCFDLFAFLYFGHCIVCVLIFLPFFILTIVLSVLRSFCLSLFRPLYCLCCDPFAFLYFGHCIVCASIFLPFFILAIVLSVFRSFCLSLFWSLFCLCMAKIKKGKRIAAQTIQWPK